MLVQLAVCSVVTLTTLADSQLNKYDKYLLRVYSVEKLLIMDSGPVRLLYQINMRNNASHWLLL